MSHVILPSRMVQVPEPAEEAQVQQARVIGAEVKKMVSVAFTQHSEAGQPSKDANLVDQPTAEELTSFF